VYTNDTRVLEIGGGIVEVRIDCGALAIVEVFMISAPSSERRTTVEVEAVRTRSTC